MVSENEKQITDLIKNSINPLIVISGRSNLEAVSGALGLFLMFKKTGKSPQIVSSASLAGKFDFLPEVKSIDHNISNEAIYKIAVNVANNDLQQVSYDQENDLLNIYLTVKKGKIKIDSVVLDGAKFKYDLVIALGVPNLNSLGKIYFENKDMFSAAPIINIDHGVVNERFGTINLIEPESAQMVSSIASIIKNILSSGIDEKIATLLLASVISATDNFQMARIDSKLFALAASLIDSGAQREEIIRHLYGPKTVAPVAARAEIVSGENLKKKLDTQAGRISR